LKILDYQFCLQNRYILLLVDNASSHYDLNSILPPSDSNFNSKEETELIRATSTSKTKSKKVPNLQQNKSQARN
ncbi:12186_t:CDS:1, partial [Racocetra fulgida]